MDHKEELKEEFDHGNADAVSVYAEMLESSDQDSERDDDEPIEKPDYVSEIVRIIESNLSPRVLMNRLSDYHDFDISDALKLLSPERRKKIYRVLGADTLSNIIGYADEDEAAQYLGEMDLKKAADVISHMDTDVAIDILRAMDKVKRSLMLDLVDEDFRREVVLLASFDEDEIGSKMTTNYIVIHDNLSVKEAMNALVQQAPDNDNISTLFVLDEQDVFSGAIDLKELIIARQGTPLDKLIMTSYPYVYGTEEIDDCIERLKDYEEDLIPVLDNQNKLLGVITSQSIIEVVDEELGEDYARLAGLTAEEDLEEPLKDSMRKRLPWLSVLMILGFVVSSAVGAFEAVISELTIIILFQSMILDMSGNVGTQSLAVTIRVIMDENLTASQKLWHVIKEVRVGFMNGIIICLGSFILVGLYVMLMKGRSVGAAFAISGCVGASLLIAMTISALVGTVIPMFFKKIHIDPAVASGPLITTVNDLVAVVTYYSMAWVLLIKCLGMGA